jgi:hypothetical protein
VSRRVNVAVDVRCDEHGEPTEMTLPDAAAPVAVLSVLSRWREWMGVLSGEPERDVWHVDTERGVCELHCLRYPSGRDHSPPGRWFLARWDD